MALGLVAAAAPSPEIDPAIAELRSRGAASIVLVGHSIGGAAAIDYAATHDGVAGIIGLAASDSVFPRLPDDIQESIDRARVLVAQHQGDAVDLFADRAAGYRLGMRTSARNYLSFLAPESQVMLVRAARIRAPLLVVAGSGDGITREYQQRAFGRIPHYALNRFVTVRSDHYHVPDAAEDVMLQWLGDLSPAA